MIGEHQVDLRDRSNTRTRFNGASSLVRVSVAIQAEWARILNALMVPEYMDLWLTMPGTERLECCPEQRFAGGFRIDIFADGREPKTIYGSCLRTRQNEISYLWERTHGGNTARSVVKLRLRSGPRRCSLQLKHHGLWSQNEVEWYSRMWQESLERLRDVMESIPRRVEQS